MRRRGGAAHGVLGVGDELLLPLRRRADAGDAAAGRHRAVGPRQGRRRVEDGHALPLGPLRLVVAALAEELAPLGLLLHGVGPLAHDGLEVAAERLELRR